MGKITSVLVASVLAVSSSTAAFADEDCGKLDDCDVLAEVFEPEKNGWNAAYIAIPLAILAIGAADSDDTSD